MPLPSSSLVICNGASLSQLHRSGASPMIPPVQENAHDGQGLRPRPQAGLSPSLPAGSGSARRWVAGKAPQSHTLWPVDEGGSRSASPPITARQQLGQQAAKGPHFQALQPPGQHLIGAVVTGAAPKSPSSTRSGASCDEWGIAAARSTAGCVRRDRRGGCPLLVQVSGGRSHPLHHGHHLGRSEVQIRPIDIPGTGVQARGLARWRRRGLSGHHQCRDAGGMIAHPPHHPDQVWMATGGQDAPISLGGKPSLVTAP